MILRLHDIRYGRSTEVQLIRYKNGEERFEVVHPDAFKRRNVIIDCGELLDKDDFYSLLQILNVLEKVCKPYVYMPYILGSRNRDDAQFNVDLMYEAGAEGIITLDAHDPSSLEGVENILPEIYLAQYLADKSIDIVIAPDKGAFKKAEILAHHLGVKVGSYKKFRVGGDTIEVEYVGNEGELKGKRCIIVDDIIDSGKTMLTVIDNLRSNGAVVEDIYATHCLMTGNIEQFHSRDINVMGITGNPDEYIFVRDKDSYRSTMIYALIPKIILKDKGEYYEM